MVHFLLVVSTQPLASSPVVAATEAVVVAGGGCFYRVPAWGGGLTVSMDAAGGVGEPAVENLRGRYEAGPTKILRVLEHEEKVQVADQDADEFHHASTGDDQVEAKEDPRQVHGFELGPEPEVDDDVLVKLAPDVQDAQYHRVHEERNRHRQGHDGAAHPVEEEHEEVVGWSSVEDSRLQPQRVVVQEKQVDQEMEPSRRAQRVVEKGRHRSPYLELLDQRLEQEHQPRRGQHPEPTQKGEQDCAPEPITGELRQAPEPVLNVPAHRHGWSPPPGLTPRALLARFLSSSSSVEALNPYLQPVVD